MSHTHSTTNKRTFYHLTIQKRMALQIYLEEGRSVSYIADKLSVSRSTVYREIARGTVEQMDSNLKKYRKYFAESGQLAYETHRKNSRKPYKLAKAQSFVSKVVDLVKEERWSIDAAVGYINRYGMFEETVSTKTIYNYIDVAIIPLKSIDLPLRVRRKIKRTICRQNRRMLGTSIDHRPNITNEFGHWEIDTVVGTRAKGNVLLTLDERLTKKRIMVRINDKTAQAVENAIRAILASYGELAPYIFKSITADNGSEFATLEKALPNLKVYYCHPYASYERGINEKQNSLVRRFIPKGRAIERVSDATIIMVEDYINNLPRKKLGYQTPAERFKIELEQCSIHCCI